MRLLGGRRTFGWHGRSITANDGDCFDSYGTFRIVGYAVFGDQRSVSTTLLSWTEPVGPVVITASTVVVTTASGSPVRITEFVGVVVNVDVVDGSG